MLVWIKTWWPERDQRRSPFETVWKTAGTLKKKTGDHNQSDQPTT